MALFLPVLALPTALAIAAHEVPQEIGEFAILLDQGWSKKKIIAIKGDVVNVSSRNRKIPWLRFGLKDGAKAEVYTWQLDTAARPLNPGESTGFVTRIASPPETAGEVEIRFARAGEIGSNTGHE